MTRMRNLPLVVLVAAAGLVVLPLVVVVVLRAMRHA